ncbi:calcium-binding protein [Falsiroseomonas stagni]|uniref:Ca2+-binding protein, RTX toxin-related n=1 Tax=Falsiroseomonas stagni DSM 19981 TaxID=1123062 RepID=A0A1I4BUU9_9PROT|nr:calcium-binding protein [Falsiroseomonas stagni]SFK71839.1 Ca2+-binding protein, RTX toxin-related [Falsiroseomonas stagni DSM 19981]
MNINLLVRGQSNAILLMESNGWSGAGTITREVQRLLGFDGVKDTVSLVYDRFDANSSTAFGGTALIGDWLKPAGTGWQLGSQEQALLNEIADMSVAQRADPTAVLWLHSEYDSANASLTTEQWVSALRYDAALVRAALGQGAATVPYNFVSAMPYWGTEEGHQAIRRGMEQLAADASFNASIAARMQDINATTDDWDSNPNTIEYGGGHIDAGDAAQTVLRAARGIAESLAEYAKAGSIVAQSGGDIADKGPQVVRATLTAADQLRIDVAHDHAAGFQALDADAATGLGWCVQGAGGTVWGKAATLVDGDTLLVAFSGPVPAGGTLFYGYGYGRLAGADGSGRGNAVYDDQGMPIWVAAEGLRIGATVTPPPAVTNLTLTGTAGDDALAGGAGADTIGGGAGSDDLQGGAGDDRLAGGAGDDGLTLGAGADVVVFTKGDGVDWVVDFTPGTDRLELHGFAAAQVFTKAASYWGMAGLDVLLPNGEKLFLQGVTALGASDLVLKDVPVVVPAGLVLAGTAGNDTLKGGALADSLSGGAGHDYLQGFAGHDTLAGGAGNDVLLGNDGNDLLLGGDGDDQLRGHAGSDILTTGLGVDRVYIAKGDGQDRVTDFTLGTDKVVLSGITAADVTAKVAVVSGIAGLQLTLSDGTSLFLEGLSAVTAKQLGLSGSFAAGSTALPATTATVLGTAGDDWLKGGTGADYLQGGAGSDDLQGLGGNDVLRGGLGDDGLTGGAGADLFVFAKGDGQDWVVDFARGTDRLRLEGYAAGDLTQAVETRWGMVGLAIDLGTGGDEVFLQGVTAVLGANDLIFA